jgi:hypothetical protein
MQQVPAVLRLTNRPTDQQTNRPTDQQTNRPTDQQTNRPTDQQHNELINVEIILKSQNPSKSLSLQQHFPKLSNDNHYH